MVVFLIQHIFRPIRRFCSTASNSTMKYLNVAEKNDAAKNIAAILSRGASHWVICDFMKFVVLK